MASKNVIIVGGHGNVSQRLAKKLASSNHSVTSIIRTPSHVSDIEALPAKPLLLSLEDAPVGEFAKAFQGQDVVVFSAGAGASSNGGARTKAVDYEGALKVFDAIEAVDGPKPRLVLVSAIDVRDPGKIPAHYNEADIAASKKGYEAIGTYFRWKYEADKNLIKRTAFKWTILRPGGLTNTPGTGQGDIGKTHITESVSRDDVATVLALIVDREDAAGLALDLVGGEKPLEDGLSAAIKKRVTDFEG